MVFQTRLLFTLWALTSLLTTCSHAFTSPVSVKLVRNGVQSKGTSQKQEESVLASAADANGFNNTDYAPRQYYSAEARCDDLSPVTFVSQAVVGPFKAISRAVSNVFSGINRKKISSLGVTFALSYSIISNINGSVSLSIAWYMSSQRTGLSPLAPGQWKSLLKAYGTLYAVLQLLRPLRVAAAIALSKWSGEFLEATQERLDCSRAAAVVFQYALGLMAWIACGTTGIALASMLSGVPIW